MARSRLRWRLAGDILAACLIGIVSKWDARTIPWLAGLCLLVYAGYDALQVIRDLRGGIHTVEGVVTDARFYFRRGELLTLDTPRGLVQLVNSTGTRGKRLKGRAARLTCGRHTNSALVVEEVYG